MKLLLPSPVSGLFRRIAMPLAATAALLMVHRLDRPEADASPGIAAAPVASHATEEVGKNAAPGPGPEPETVVAEVLPEQERLAQVQREQAFYQQQAILAQAAAAEQAQLLRFQEMRLRQEAELRTFNAQLRAHEAAERQMRRYQEDVSGYLHSTLGE